MNTGKVPVLSKYIINYVAWQIGNNVLCIEGSVFIGGAFVQWLRDEMALIDRSQDARPWHWLVLVAVYVVPAFTGLGTPYWDDVHGAVFGLTRATAVNLSELRLKQLLINVKMWWKSLKRNEETSISLRVDGEQLLINI